MTLEIRRFVVQVVTDRSFARWMAVVTALVAALVLNAPTGGGGGV